MLYLSPIQGWCVTYKGDLFAFMPVAPRYTQPATYTDEREAPPLDTRCRFNYPECAPTCVNRYVARNSTIYKFPNKGSRG